MTGRSRLLAARDRCLHVRHPIRRMGELRGGPRAVEIFHSAWPRRALHVVMLLDIALVACGVLERKELFIFVGVGLSLIAGFALGLMQNVRKTE